MTKGIGVLLPYIKPDDVYRHRPHKHNYLPIPKGMFIKIKGSRKTVRLVFLRLSMHKEITVTKESIDYTLKLRTSLGCMNASHLGHTWSSFSIQVYFEIQVRTDNDKIM